MKKTKRINEKELQRRAKQFVIKNRQDIIETFNQKQSNMFEKEALFEWAYVQGWLDALRSKNV